MSQVLVLALVFLGALSLIVGLYTLLNRDTLAASEAALRQLREEDFSPELAHSILRRRTASELPMLDRVLTGRDITTILVQRLQRAGIEMTPGAFLLRVAIVSLLGVLLGRAVSASMLTTAAGGLLGGSLPFLWLRLREAKRLTLFQEQLPEAIDMLVSAMGAGYSFQAAMKFIGEETAAPLGPEFARFYEEQRLGMEVRTALYQLQDRVDSLDLRMFVTAVIIQRETGGNLAEVLAKISGVMRERAAIKGEIMTMTAESKLSARILGALPFVVFAAVSVLNPGFLKPMLEMDSAPWIFTGAALSVAVGYWMMMRIADIDV